MTTKTDITQERAAFEVAFSRPPFEWGFDRHGEDSAWPGNYRKYHHQCAWEGWQARAAVEADRQGLIPDPLDYSTKAELYVTGWNDCRAACISKSAEFDRQDQSGGVTEMVVGHIESVRQLEVR